MWKRDGLPVGVIVLATVATLVVGCGGGGGAAPQSPGSEHPPPVATPPSSERSPVQFSASPAQPRSAVTLDDGTTLVLMEFHGADPNVVSVARIDPSGHLVANITVASRPAAVGDAARPTVYASTIVSDGKDSAFIAWKDYVPNAQNSDEEVRLHVRRYRRDSGLEPEILVRGTASTSTIYEFALADAPGGPAVLAWIEPGPRDPITQIRGAASVFVSTHDGSGWSAPQLLVTGSGFSTDDPELVAAGSRNGRSVVTWTVRDEPRIGSMLMARTRTQDGAWSEPAVIFQHAIVDDGPVFEKIEPVLDNAGNTMVMWRVRTNTNGGTQEIGYNRFEPTSGWLGADYLVQEFSDDLTPTIVMNGAGAGILAWREGWNIVAAHFDPTGWKNAYVLSPDELNYQFSAYPHIIIQEDGSASATWNQAYLGSVVGPHYVVRMSRYNVSSGWAKAKTISPLDDVAFNEMLTPPAGGKTLAVWYLGDWGGGRGTLWSMQFDVTGAQATGVTPTIAPRLTNARGSWRESTRSLRAQRASLSSE